MDKREETLNQLEENYGGGKDNVLILSTVALETTADGKPRPAVREVDAIYEDGAFYITTYGKSNKIMQIEQNDSVAFAFHFGDYSGNGIGKNLGWVMKPENAALRVKLRKAFADWYDAANNDQSEDCVILAIKITSVHVFRDHGAVNYTVDFAE